MVKLCLMASYGYPLGFASNPELGSCRISKDCQPLLPGPGSRHEMIRLDALNVTPHQSVDPWKPVSGFPKPTQLVKVDSTTTKPVLIDVQDNHTNSILFSFGIVEICTRYEKILQFLMSGSNEVQGGGLDFSMLSDLIGLQALTNSNIHQNAFTPDFGAGFQPSLLYSSSQFYAQRAFLDLVGDLARRSDFKFDPDGRVSFTGSSTELKHILSVVAEYHSSKNSTQWRKQSFLIPHFDRLDCIETKANVHKSNVMVENVTFTPLKSPRKSKVKSSPNKKTNKKARERDLYTKNYFHACECLLSIMIDKKHSKSAILSLKKFSGELPELLMQFSASIAGTGIAVIFSVICKVAYSRVPFCASKLSSTGIGLGLVWLSWAVNRLRETVVYISRSSGKLDVKEEEMITKLDGSVKDIYFRAATVMAVAMLRLA
ncbi:uncharacterized protein LOC131313602 [Rhododendron vialii]|uniref:uncharacterized protein LOC131313602 n=1 Tax=Rhododendron vialii TaxID=182163 RepID=UPI00265E3404|nr:uncharacterized protein LOC131313602 [Rhododendron vialii]